MKKNLALIVMIFACFCLTSCSLFGKIVENPKSNINDSSDENYQVEKYTVIFQSNGGNDIDSQYIESGKQAFEPEKPEKKGYVFGGWYTDSNLTNRYRFSDDVTGNLTLYAKWEKQITDSNGFLMNNQTILANALYSGYMSDFQGVDGKTLSGNQTGFLGFALDVTKSTTLQSRCLNTQNMVLDYNKLLSSDVHVFRLNDMNAKSYVASGESLTEVSNNTKVHFKVSMDGSIGFAGNSVAVGLANTYNTFTSSKKSFHNYFSVVDWFMNCYQVNLQTPNGNSDYWKIASSTFKSDVQKLNDGNMNAELFISKYGTHLLTSANLGGYYSTYTYYYTENTFEQKEFESICETNISVNASFKGIGANTSLNTQEKYSNEALKSEKRIMIEQTCMYAGGTSKYLDAYSTRNEINDWAETIPTNPTLTSLVNEESLLEIYEIIPSSYNTAIDKLKTYYKEYVSQALHDFQLQYSVSEKEETFGSLENPIIDSTSIDLSKISDNTKILNFYFSKSKERKQNKLIIPKNIENVYIYGVSNDGSMYVSFEIENRNKNINFYFNNADLCTLSHISPSVISISNDQSNLINVNFHFTGDNKIYSSTKYEYTNSNNSVIALDSVNLKITSDENANIKMYSEDALWSSKNSDRVITCNKIDFNITSSNIIIESGNGAKGPNGANSTNKDSNGSNGENGGNSNYCVYANEVIIDQKGDSIYMFKSGNGGNGGDGGKGFSRDGEFLGNTAEVTNGGNGGDGGNSYDPLLSYNIKINGNLEFVSIVRGKPGTGGAGGKGGVAKKITGKFIYGTDGINGYSGLENENGECY